MLRMSESLFNIPIISLRLGQRIGVANDPIINPHNLKIIGWWCSETKGGTPLVLLTDDIRENSPKGLAVNDQDALSSAEDLVRHKEILDTRFSLVDKLVKTKRRKIGRVQDFSYNDGMFVQKLYVQKSLIKVFTSEDTVIVDRTQILEVTDTYILVRDTEVAATEEEMAGATVPA